MIHQVKTIQTNSEIHLQQPPSRQGPDMLSLISNISPRAINVALTVIFVIHLIIFLIISCFLKSSTLIPFLVGNRVNNVFT